MSASGDAAAGGQRRIVALWLPELLVELTALVAAEEAPRGGRPLAVVVHAPTDERPVDARSRLHAVNAEARALGVVAGQSIAEARALVGRLVVRVLTPDQLRAALGRVAEACARFGSLLAIEPPVADGREPVADTVWLDVSASATLFGGEAALLAALADTARALGHVTRVAIAVGPLLAQALARWAANAEGLAFDTPAALGALPVAALPLGGEQRALLLQLGLTRFEELRRLPPSTLGPRLGERGSLCLALVQGRDELALTAYERPVELEEQLEWEEPVTGISPLRFVVRGLVSRLAARLLGRGQAIDRLRLELALDRGLAAQAGVPALVVSELALPAPLWREEELRRLVEGRLAQLTLPAPTRGLALRAARPVPAPARQLAFSRLLAGGVDDEQLPGLLAELSSELGRGRVGVLQLRDGFRPEQTSALVAPKLTSTRGGRRRRRGPVAAESERSSKLLAERWPLTPHTPSRVLEKPVPLSSLELGATVRLGGELCIIRGRVFSQRLEQVEWWLEGGPLSRDYYRLRLEGRSGVLEAQAFVDRIHGGAYLQAVDD